MIGPRGGIKCGIMGGVRTGVGTDPLAPQGAQTTMTISVVDNASGVVITGGDAFAYTVQFTNTGTGNALLVSVATTLDASLTYVSSSGTGWAIGVVGQVVTATQASIAPGAATPITINVTTGTSALTATTGVTATATNAATHTATSNVTVNLVTKDATSHIYWPSSSTEWTNFIARKGLAVSAPSSLFNCQDASGNLADSIGSIVLTASGTTRNYQQAVTGWSRKAVTNTTDGGTSTWQSTQAGLPNISATSMACLALVLFPTAAPAAARNLIEMGTSATRVDASLNTTPVVRVVSTPSHITVGASNPTGVATVRPVIVMTNLTGSHNNVYTDQEKIVGTFAAGAGQNLVIGSGAIAGGYLGLAMFQGSAAEVSDANWKSLLQALGFTIPWS